MILSKKRITKALIRLRGCAGWSAPVLFAKPLKTGFSRRGPCIYYTMTCAPVRGDNPGARANTCRLAHILVEDDNHHGITMLYRLHQYRSCTLRDIVR